MKQRVVLFDGAMGTEIQKLNPLPEDFPDGKDGFNDGLSFTRPEWIKNIHRSYLRAGADCIETNTFGSNKLKLDEYHHKFFQPRLLSPLVFQPSLIVGHETKWYLV